MLCGVRTGDDKKRGPVEVEARIVAINPLVTQQCVSSIVAGRGSDLYHCQRYPVPLLAVQ